MSTVPGDRDYGAAGQNRSHWISWAAKQEKIQPAWISFFLTSSFIELTDNLGTGTQLSGERLSGTENEGSASKISPHFDQVASVAVSELLFKVSFFRQDCDEMHR
jgi:hypothetical protein